MPQPIVPDKDTAVTLGTLPPETRQLLSRLASDIDPANWSVDDISRVGDHLDSLFRIADELERKAHLLRYYGDLLYSRLEALDAAKGDDL